MRESSDVRVAVVVAIMVDAVVVDCRLTVFARVTLNAASINNPDNTHIQSMNVLFQLIEAVRVIGAPRHVITALHALHAKQSSHEKAVRLSVRLSNA